MGRHGLLTMLERSSLGGKKSHSPVGLVNELKELGSEAKAQRETAWEVPMLFEYLGVTKVRKINTENLRSVNERVQTGLV